MIPPPQTTPSPLLREFEFLTAKARRHGNVASMALLCGVLTAPLGKILAKIGDRFGHEELLTNAALALGIVAIACFAWQRTLQWLAEGRKKDLSATATVAKNPEEAMMPAATLLWMAARRRTWLALRRPVFWLAGEILAAGLFFALGSFWTAAGLGLLLLMIMAPVTLLAVIMRAAEFLIVSQWRWHERQAEAAAKSAHHSPGL